MTSLNIKYENEKVETTFDKLLVAPKFTNWVKKVTSCPSTLITDIVVTDVDWFCSPTNIDPNKLGFVKARVIGTDTSTGNAISSVAFVRGSAVSVLLIVNVTGLTNTKYVLMCQQLRIPVGERCFEAPAGMMDSSENISGVMIKEIQEETGLIVPNASMLMGLGSFYPSPGGCDEEIHLYAWETTVTSEKYAEMCSKVYGVENENEAIKLHFYSMDDFERELSNFKDAKVEIAYGRYLYNRFKVRM